MRAALFFVLGVAGLAATFPPFGMLNVGGGIAGLIGGTWFCVCLIAGFKV